MNKSETRIKREVERVIIKAASRSGERVTMFGGEEVTITKEANIEITKMILAIDSLKQAYGYEFAVTIVMTNMCSLMLNKDYDDETVLKMIKARQKSRVQTV